MKPGSFCIWCVNDFRKNKIFYPYHAYLIFLFEDAGFEIYTIYIIDFGLSIAGAFVQDIIDFKYFPKRHEYCLVFRKPG